LESICEAERNSLKIVGERRKVCEVSLEILDFWSMIQCYTGWLLAYFVGTEGITLAMFLPVTRKIELCPGIEDFK